MFGVRFLRSSFSFSLLVHAIIIAVAAFVLGHRAANQSPEKNWTMVELAPAPPQSPKHVNNEDLKIHQKVVETSRAQDSKTPAKDAYLGERTQTADRQTVSKDHRITMGKDTAKPTPRADDRTQKASPSSKKVAQKATTPLPPPIRNLGIPIVPSVQKQEEYAHKEKDDRRWASTGEQAPEDYVKGMAESERTVLNTKEFVFFGYYQRIRERLDRAWVPILKANLAAYYRRGRTLASETEHSTHVMVTLDDQGRITRVQITGESGTSDLDDAAVKAFNLAGPFPNPPRGMVDPKGEIKVPWEFILRT
jgi:TonB family protein